MTLFIYRRLESIALIWWLQNCIIQTNHSNEMLGTDDSGKACLFREVVLTQINEFMLYSPLPLLNACVFEGIFIIV